MGEELLKIFSVILVSSVKHTLLGIPLAAACGFNYLETAIYTAIGGIGGLLVFMFLEEQVERLWRRIFPLKVKRRVFTKRNRIIVKVKKNFGLYGIALLTPAILSIPVGTVVACALYKDRRKVFLFIFVAIVAWSLLGAAFSQEIMEWVGKPEPTLI